MVTVPMRVKTIFASLAAVLVIACGTATADSVQGDPRTKIQGQKIKVTDGNLEAMVQLSKDGTAKTFDGQGREHQGMWWVRPDFRVCVALKALWEGGDCGFVQNNGGLYVLTVAPWTQPIVNAPLGEARYKDFKRPVGHVSVVKLKAASLAGRAIKANDQYSAYTLAFAADGTFQYRDDLSVTFKGHYWTQNDGRLCLASRKYWRIGWCATVYGSGGAISHLNPSTSPDFWMPAAFASNTQ